MSQEIEGIKLQNSLGRMEGFYRTDMNMSGFMALARVIKVHHKSGTADIVLANTRDSISSSKENEGKFSARIMQRGSYYDEKTKRYWGSIDPIAEGSLVLIAFLDTMKHRPVILGCFHRPDNEQNVYQETYPLKEKLPGMDRREALKQLRVSPALTYKKIDGEGNIEVTYGSRSFFASYNTAMDIQGHLKDTHGGFDHQDLSEVDKNKGGVLSTDWEEAKAPAKFLFVHRSYDNPKWTKLFIDEDGKLRFTRDNNDGKLSFIEMHQNGAIKLRRQLDDPYHNQGEKATEITITENGEVQIKHHSGSSIVLDNNGDLIMNARFIKMNEWG